MGAKKRPFYRIVVADSRAPRDGRFIDIVGYYDPLPDPFVLKINEEKARLWLSRGAQPTDTVRFLFQQAGILDGGKAQEEKVEETPSPETSASTETAEGEVTPTQEASPTPPEEEGSESSEDQAQESLV